MNWQFQQLRKSADDRILGGVCGGLGAGTPVPAIVWRVLFLLSLVANGAGFLVYVLMWWLMPPAHSANVSAASEWNLQALRRSDNDVQIAGICGGLGECTPVPSWLWRVAFISLAFAGGLGLLGYVLLWILVPRSSRTISAA